MTLRLQLSVLLVLEKGLKENAEAKLLDWIPVDSQLRAARLSDSYKVGSFRSHRQFVCHSVRAYGL